VSKAAVSDTFGTCSCLANFYYNENNTCVNETEFNKNFDLISQNITNKTLD